MKSRKYFCISLFVILINAICVKTINGQAITGYSDEQLSKLWKGLLEELQSIRLQYEFSSFNVNRPKDRQSVTQTTSLLWDIHNERVSGTLSLADDEKKKILSQVVLNKKNLWQTYAVIKAEEGSVNFASAWRAEKYAKDSVDCPRMTVEADFQKKLLLNAIAPFHLNNKLKNVKLNSITSGNIDNDISIKYDVYDADKFQNIIRKIVYVVHPNKNYRISSTKMYLVEDNQDRLIMDINCANIEKYGSSWFPNRIVYTYYNSSGQIDEKREFKIQALEINPNIGDNDFEYQPEVGTKVVDHEKNVEYVVGRANVNGVELKSVNLDSELLRKTIDVDKNNEKKPKNDITSTTVQIDEKASLGNREKAYNADVDRKMPQKVLIIFGVISIFALTSVIYIFSRQKS